MRWHLSLQPSQWMLLVPYVSLSLLKSLFYQRGMRLNSHSSHVKIQLVELYFHKKTLQQIVKDVLISSICLDYKVSFLFWQKVLNQNLDVPRPTCPNSMWYTVFVSSCWRCIRVHFMSTCYLSVMNVTEVHMTTKKKKFYFSVVFLVALYRLVKFIAQHKLNFVNNSWISFA